MTREEWEEERADRCYECTGYGDNWYEDENGDSHSACDDCYWNKDWEEDDD